jgi:hypothetical protein
VQPLDYRSAAGGVTGHDRALSLEADFRELLGRSASDAAKPIDPRRRHRLQDRRTFGVVAT